MFCTNCGRNLSEAHRYCGACGAPVAYEPGPVGTAPKRPAPEAPDANWQDSIDYKTVLGHDDVEKLIAGASGTNPGGMSADEFLSAAKPLLLLTGAKHTPLKLIAEVGPGLYAKLGITTGKEMEKDFTFPPGRVIAAVLCSLASRNQTLSEGDQAKDGCVLVAKLPSSMWSWAGVISVTFTRYSNGCRVGAKITIPGQAFDWGKSKGSLADLFEDIPRFISLQS
ncbi:MAG: zinc ribbon domain-containing protein [Rhodobacteraceae bacterium]|nr:zinc ribbon domain-containing protein [Paracoccaceae bacterium]